MSEQTTTTEQPVTAEATAQMLLKGLVGKAYRAGQTFGYHAYMVKRDVDQAARRMSDPTPENIRTAVTWFSESIFQNYNAAHAQYVAALDLDWSIMAALESLGVSYEAAHDQIKAAQQRGYDKGFSGHSS
jgi:hypothetical protein